ncbi:MAG: rhombosortase [Candidatus Tritonobacter lacicola]|nr:rhombosortase [Candidatus Tritonobacter lacicola]
MVLSTKLKARLKAIPFITLAIGLRAVLLARLPAAGRWLCYDRAAVEAGELWRIVTCHFVHVNFSHLIWDLAALLALGLMFEVKLGKSFAISLIGATVLIPVSIFFFQPDLIYYCGLSGLDTAAYTLCACYILKTALEEKRPLTFTLMCTAFGALAFKIIYEFHTGLTLFADPRGTALVPVPLAHIVGGAIGIVSFALFLLKGQRSFLETPDMEGALP